MLARHLITHGYNVKTYIVNYSTKRSKDFLINYDRIKGVTKDWPILLSCEEEFPQIHNDDIIVDAVFGIGLNRPADEWVKQLFMHFRNSRAFTLAVDMPSGLFADSATDMRSTAVFRADYTLSFQLPKLAFLLPENDPYVGKWQLLDIGLSPDFINNAETTNFYMQKMYQFYFQNKKGNKIV